MGSKLTEDERAWEAELLSYGDMDPTALHRTAKLTELALQPASWYTAPIERPEAVTLFVIRFGRRLRRLLGMR